MIRGILTIFLFFSFTIKLSSQGENNIWYFNSGLGLDFNFDPPIVLRDGQIPSLREGVSTVCDNTGNLLFYSDGLKIWDRNHNLMPNGSNLQGNATSTQSVLIVPRPMSDSQYYVFTVSSRSHAEGKFMYSLVDMQLNSGFGDVEPLQKNILITNNVTEKLVAAKGLCGEVWVIVHERDNNHFLSFKVDEFGISNPIKSIEGEAHIGSDSDPTITITAWTGQMKVSPNFKKLALATLTGIVELFDFNRETGKINNPIFLPTENFEGQLFKAYGLSFSPDSNLLYTSEGDSRPSGQFLYLYQYDIRSGDSQIILNSKTLVAQPEMWGHIFDIALGSNQVIYIPRKRRDYLGAILYPNFIGQNCMYRDSVIYIGPATTNSMNLQNPVVVPSPIPDIQPNFLGPDTILCTGQSLEVAINQPNASYLWNDDSKNSTIQIETEGSYWLEMDIYGCLFYDTIRVDFVEQTEDLIRDTFLCPGQKLVLNLPEGEGLWQDGSFSNEYEVMEAGTYWVEMVDNEGCIIRDTAIVQGAIGNIIDLGQDTTICDESQLLISLPAGYNYEWQDGQSTEEYLITESGAYWVEIQDNFGCIDRDSIDVIFSSLPKPDLGSDSIICPGDTLILASNVFADNYLWNTSAQIDEIIITEHGEYWLEIEKDGCKAADTIQILGDPNPFDLGRDTTICQGEELEILLPEQGEYIWQDGQQGFEYQISRAGTYWVESQSGCRKRDSIQVEVIELDADIIYTDTMICNEEPVLLAIDNTETTYHWSTGSQDSFIIVQSPGLYSVSISQNSCEAIDSIEILESNFTVDLGNDTTLCFDEILNLDASVTGASYLWQDGSNLPTIGVNQTGKYWVDVDMLGCVLSDTINITNTSFSIDLGSDTSLCEGEEMVLDASVPGASYEWQDGSNSPDLSISQSGIYWVEVSLNSCLTRDSVEVTEIEFEVNLGRDTSLCAGDRMVLDAYVPGAGYFWQDGSTNSNFEVDQPGSFWVDVTLENCTKRDEILVEMSLNCSDPGIYIPNAFSPNGDGINDEFKVFSTLELNDFTLKIYNRWGEMVFESFHQDTGWDGFYKGKRLASGVYVAMISYKPDDSLSIQTIAQTLTLIF